LTERELICSQIVWPLLNRTLKLISSRTDIFIVIIISFFIIIIVVIIGIAVDVDDVVIKTLNYSLPLKLAVDSVLDWNLNCHI